MTYVSKRSAKILNDFEVRCVKPCDGKTLIVGSRIYPKRPDRRPLHRNVVGIDMLAGEGVDLVLNLEDVAVVPGAPFDHAECISVLEHSKRPWLLASNLQRSLRSGATLFVTVPFVWRVHGYPSDYWRFTPAGLRLLFDEIEWLHLEYANHTLLSEEMRVESIDVKDWQHFPRTEVYGFGVRR